jgi:3-hydroxybutyryl-CoA dehydrogenase
MRFELIDLGGSRSVPEGDSLRQQSSTSARATLVIGGDAVARARAFSTLDISKRDVVAVELGTECLGFHLGEGADAPANVVGFARFQLGRLPASSLVELVRLRGTDPAALAAAQAVFEAAGLDCAISMDVPGRIVDSLLRPYLNAAMRSVDEGLAAPQDMDQALRLGLGFPRGPSELLDASGLEEHFEVSEQLHQALGTDGFVPGRRARVQASRNKAGLG